MRKKNPRTRQRGTPHVQQEHRSGAAGRSRIDAPRTEPSQMDPERRGKRQTKKATAAERRRPR